MKKKTVRYSYLIASETLDTFNEINNVSWRNYKTAKTDRSFEYDRGMTRLGPMIKITIETIK